MPITPQPPFPKSRGDTVRSGDFNATIDELVRLDGTKVNRTGDMITGGLTVEGRLLVGSAPSSALFVNQSAPADEDLFGALVVLDGAGKGFKRALSLTANGGGINQGLSVITQAAGDGSATGISIDASGAGTAPAWGMNVNASGGGNIVGGSLFCQCTGDQSAVGLQQWVAGDGKGPRIGSHVIAQSGTAGANGIGSQVTATNSGDGFMQGMGINVQGAGKGPRSGLDVFVSGDANGGPASGGSVSVDVTGINAATGLNVNASGNGAGRRTAVGAFASGGAQGAQVAGLIASASPALDNSAIGVSASASGSGTGQKIGILASASGGGSVFAGFFQGNVHVAGDLSKASGSFLFDHPLDPENKTLRHNFVESPEHLCLYRGTVTLDERGRGSVTLPKYFVALTDESRATVHVTPVGDTPFAASYAWNSRHTGLTVHGTAGAEVAYLVISERDDPVIKQLAQPVEQQKGNGNFEKGQLLNPEAFGKPLEAGVEHAIATQIAEGEVDAKAEGGPLAAAHAAAARSELIVPEPPALPELPQMPEPPELPKPPNIPSTDENEAAPKRRRR